jgi:ABC-type transport system involved in cytochrome c biogenesis permease subunit
MMMKKGIGLHFTGKISIAIMVIIILLMAIFTIVEKYAGTEYVLSECYGSWLFFLLWGLLAVSGIIYICSVKLWRKLPTMLLHLSLIIILIGAAMTYIFSCKGSVSLTEDKPVNTFTTDDGQTSALDFDLILDNFNIEYYPGSSFPMNYHATVKANGKRYNLSMNKIATIGRFSFCLNKFDVEQGRVTLSVSYDEGARVAYVGFILFFISALMMLAWRKGEFNDIRKRMARISAVLILILAGNASLSAQIIEKEDASALSSLLVESNGRLMPIESLSWSLMTKIHGSATVQGMDPTQALVDMYLNSSDWGDRKIIKIKSAKVRHILGVTGNYASYNDFITDDNRYKLTDALQHTSGESDLAAIQSSDERFQIMRSIIEGDVFKIFPAKTKEGIRWFSPVDRLPQEVDGDQYIFIRNAFNLLTELLIMRRHADFQNTVAKINKYQIKTAGNEIPTTTQRKSEHLLNLFRLIPLFAIALLCGIAGWIISLTDTIKKRVSKPAVTTALTIVIGVMTLLVAVEFALKWFVGEHIPLGNGPETMAFTSLLIGLIYLLISKRTGIHPAYALLMMGLTMLVARIGNSDPQVTQLMPVLNSGLLSVHVALVMISYALFGLIFINSLTSLFIPKSETQLQDKFSLTSRLMLYPAIMLLGSGIFVGSIWANISWGRYWGWDPKETWALITLLLYALPLHRSILPTFAKPRLLNIYLAAAFLAVVVTYFGVNYFLGGMHSYN